jgi:hypothetical protein
MKTMTVSKRAKHLVTLLKEAQQENLILQSPDWEGISFGGN